MQEQQRAARAHAEAAEGRLREEAVAQARHEAAQELEAERQQLRAQVRAEAQEQMQAQRENLVAFASSRLASADDAVQ